MSWENVRLGDIAEFSNGINFDKSAYSAGTKYIGVSDFGNKFSPYYDELSEVSKDIVRDNDYLINGDIVFVRSNGNKELVGRCMLIQNPPIPVTFSGFCIRARLFNTNNYDPTFFAYHFKSPAFRKAISGTAVGANIQNLSQGRLSNYYVIVPDIKTQHRIADILFAYDNLIENNRKQIKLLEEAAQRLYKEWFVDLRFPGWDNIKIVDGVPDGWKKQIIVDLCERINAGGTPNRKKSTYWNGATIKWYKTQELQDCWLIDSDEKISEEGYNNSSTKLFPKNTILMAIYASPTLGRLGVLDSEATCNQAALCLKANESKVSWQWLYETLFVLREQYNKIARGAGQQNISGEVVKKTVVACPTMGIMNEFTTMVAPYFEKRRVLQKQIIQLIEARDRMLPKLMSGEIEV